MTWQEEDRGHAHREQAALDMPVPPDIAEARRLVMEHLARKPKRMEYTELEAWTDRAHVLNSQLEALLAGTPIAASAPP